MFKFIQKLFSTGHSSKGKKKNSYKVTKKERIIDLLEQAQQDHTLLSIRIPESKELFHTALLGVQPVQGFLVFDELKPEEGHDLFLKQPEVQLSGQLNGVALAFKTKLIEAKEKSGIAFYKVAIPDSLYFRQRRQHSRTNMTASKVPIHTQRQGEHEMLSGYVVDLSAAGIGIVLDKETTLRPGDLLPTCTVRLPDEGNISFSLRVCFSHSNPERCVTRVGGSFEKIDKASKRKIQRAVTKLERVHAKRLRKR